MTEQKTTPNQPEDSEVVCVLSGLTTNPERAARLAGELASRLGCSLALVEARMPLPAPVSPDAALMPVAPPAVLPTVAEFDAPAADLGRVADVAGVSPDRREHMSGNPGDVLAELSRRPLVRLLVTADEGGGPLGARLRGDATREALGDLDVPVVLVPKSGASVLDDPLRLLCGVTDDGAASPVVEGTRRLAAELHAEVRVAHILDGGALGVFEALAGSGTSDRGVHAQPIMAVGDPADGLLALADEDGAQLIAVGPPGHGTLGSALLGSVTHGLLKRGARPIVVIPADESRRS